MYVSIACYSGWERRKIRPLGRVEQGIGSIALFIYRCGERVDALVWLKASTRICILSRKHWWSWSLIFDSYRLDGQLWFFKKILVRQLTFNCRIRPSLMLTYPGHSKNDGIMRRGGCSVSTTRVDEIIYLNGEFNILIQRFSLFTTCQFRFELTKE